MLDVGPRREFEELLMFYELHPEEQDVLVEGQVDRAVISWFLASQNISDLFVYQLSERVEAIPDFALERLGLTRGRKNELLALARSIEERSPESRTIIAVDADHDCSVVKGRPYGANVIATDFPSMEVYLIEDYAVRKFLRLVLLLPESRIAVDEFLGGIENALRELFVIRWSLTQAVPPVRMVSNRRRRMSCANSVVSVDRDKIIADSLSASSVQDSQMPAKVTANLSVAQAFETKLVVHGHDISDVIGFWIGKSLSRTELEGKQDLKKADNVRSALFGCLEAEQLERHSFFRTLKLRVQGGDDGSAVA